MGELALCGKKGYREIGWDGFRISVPCKWDADEIGDRYVLLENDGVPVLEAKWDIAKGRFEPEKALGKLEKNIPNGKRRQTLRPCSVPKAWAKALDGFQHAGFHWNGELYSGKGVLVYCPVCRRATIMQFYETNKTTSLRDREIVDYPTVLSSFTDHPVGGNRLWSVFDIRLLLPENFKLARHVFSPGAFQIEFDANSFRASFFRWGPASVILADNRLDVFVAKTFDLGADGVEFESWGNNVAFEFQSIPPISKFRRWFLKLRKKPVYQWGRAWRQTRSNRILAVKAQSCDRFDLNIPINICGFYETV